MSLQGMTGFARSRVEDKAASAQWELRSVNGRGLDIRIRMPAGFERFEPAIRTALQKGFTRGSINATLTLSHFAGSIQPSINEALLEHYARAAIRLHEATGVALPAADGLLRLPGVIESGGAENGDNELRGSLILKSLEEAIEGLRQAREQEGAGLATLLLGHVGQIADLVQRAERDPAREPAAIQARLAEQIAAVTGVATQFDTDRLYQEVALIATKADIREELDRLAMHIEGAKALLAQKEPVGRKLDFLAQEFNRETNTLCAKSNAASITAIGLDLKAVIDQFREQIQNLE